MLFDSAFSLGGFFLVRNTACTTALDNFVNLKLRSTKAHDTWQHTAATPIRVFEREGMQKNMETTMLVGLC